MNILGSNRLVLLFCTALIMSACESNNMVRDEGIVIVEGTVFEAGGELYANESIEVTAYSRDENVTEGYSMVTSTDIEGKFEAEVTGSVDSTGEIDIISVRPSTGDIKQDLKRETFLEVSSIRFKPESPYDRVEGEFRLKETTQEN